MRKIYLIILCITVSTILAQQTVTTGNLLRINFHQSKNDFSDTLWNWITYQTKDEIKGDHCINGFRLDSTDYLIINKYEERQYYQLNKVYLFNTKANSYRFMYEYPPLIDNLLPFLYQSPKLERINNGIWIFPGILGKSIFLRSDFIQQGIVDGKLKLVHKVGKIGENYLVVFEGEKNYDFSLCLVDLSSSPEIKILSTVKLYKDSKEYKCQLESIHNIVDSTFIIKEELTNVIYLALFSKNNFHITKMVKPEGNYITIGDFTKRFYSKNNLYYLEKRKLYKESLDLTTNSYSKKDSVLFLSGTPFTFDIDSNYIAYYRNDSLFVYSIDKEEVIFKQSIAPIKKFIPGFISPPYIYFHQTQTITDVVREEDYPTEFVLHQNYPNPFNPSTTIEYVVPNILPKNSSLLQHVTLTLYDVLGKEIARLIDEVKLPGKYSVQFSPHSQMSSTVYFYRLKVGGFSDVKKMIFIK